MTIDEQSDGQQTAVESGMEPLVTALDIYRRLAEPFKAIHKRPDGLDYITGEQATRRTNESLGVDNWSFRVLEHGINAEADEYWVLGEVTAIFETQRPDGSWHERTVVKSQFGSQKLKRSRKDRSILDVGFDAKGAATDALKKCLTLIGVGLHLSHKEEIDRFRDNGSEENERGPSKRTSRDQKPTADQKLAGVTNDQRRKGQGSSQPPADHQDGGEATTYRCEAVDKETNVQCPEVYPTTKKWRKPDSSILTGQDLMTMSRLKFKRIFCVQHFAKAEAAAAEKATKAS